DRANLAAFAVAENQDPARSLRRSRRIAATSRRFDGADAKACDRLGYERATGRPGLPALFRLDRQIFRRGPDDASFGVVAQRLFGDFNGAAQVEDFFYILVG